MMRSASDIDVSALTLSEAVNICEKSGAHPGRLLGGVLHGDREALDLFVGLCSVDA
jgi:hypothetical protein